jgi:hypothetical protein
VTAPLRCLHVITGLGTGGAEMMLRKLVLGTEGRTLRNEVVSLGGVGPIGEELLAAGIPVVGLGMGAGGPNGRAVLRLARRIRASRPDVVQTWMYHANLIGGIAARMAGAHPTIWNIRASNLEAGGEKASTRAAAWISGRLARRLSQRILTNAESARDLHVALGYPADLFQVIPNGFELGRFRPDPGARADVRGELGIPADAPLVGLVARRHPMKDHPAFLAAAARIARACPGTHFLLAGDGVTMDDAELRGPRAPAGHPPGHAAPAGEPGRVRLRLVVRRGLSQRAGRGDGVRRPLRDHGHRRLGSHRGGSGPRGSAARPRRPGRRLRGAADAAAGGAPRAGRRRPPPRGGALLHGLRGRRVRGHLRRARPKFRAPSVFYHLGVTGWRNRGTKTAREPRTVPRGGPRSERAEGAGAMNCAPTRRSVGIASSPSGLGEEAGRRGPFVAPPRGNRPLAR